MSFKKASLFISGIGNDICSPFIDGASKLHIVRQNLGSIMAVSSVGSTSAVNSTGGQPSGVYCNNDGTLLVADFGHSGILSIQKDGQQDLLVGVYEDKPLKGPNSIYVAASSGDIYFTDSGSFGETGLHSPSGSLFTITHSPSGQILKPIALGYLAFPTGITASPDGKFIFVAEMMNNRVLRFYQQPTGVYHGSVFVQLAGAVGPSSLAMDRHGRLYVGQYDVKGE
jgi:gluconolactonase